VNSVHKNKRKTRECAEEKGENKGTMRNAMTREGWGVASGYETGTIC